MWHFTTSRSWPCQTPFASNLVAPELDLECVIKLARVAGAHNPADIGTKRLPSSRLKSVMAMLGMFNMSTGLVEGADDSGRICSKRQNLMSIVSVLSLLQLDMSPVGIISCLYTLLSVHVVHATHVLIACCLNAVQDHFIIFLNTQKGCDSSATDETSSVSLRFSAFTTVLGLLLIFLWICLRTNRRLNVESDAEPKLLSVNCKL